MDETPPSMGPAEQLPPIWVVYAQPAEFPDGFVVRVWWGLTPEPGAYYCRTLAQARQYIGRCGGAIRMERADRDQPHIAECWI